MLEQKIKRIEEIQEKRKTLKEKFDDVMQSLTEKEIKELKEKYGIKEGDLKDKEDIEFINKSKKIIKKQGKDCLVSFSFNRIFKGICKFKLKEKYQIKEGDYVVFNKEYIKKLKKEGKETTFFGIEIALDHIYEGNKPVKVEKIEYSTEEDCKQIRIKIKEHQRGKHLFFVAQEELKKVEKPTSKIVLEGKEFEIPQNLVEDIKKSLKESE